MIADRDIATWCGSVQTTAALGQDELFGMIQLCDQIVMSFEADAVLKVRTITVEDWMIDGAPMHPQQEVTIERGAGETITAACRRYLDQHGIGPNVSAELVTLRGSTLIHEPDGRTTEAEGAVSIQGMLTGLYTVWIRTRTDAWLPCELLGHPQPERYELNAPRLRKALTQADAALGGTLAPAPSKIAEVNGFEIKNLPVELVRAVLDL